MPAVPHWAYPNAFDLTNPHTGVLTFNEQTSSGIYLIQQDGCTFDITVRSTTNDVPQADGSILHTRFLTGTQMQITVELWETRNELACGGDLLTEMLDDLSGALRSLLNAGDNQGRLAWTVDGGNDRMLDDVRLLVYPVFTPGPPPTVVFTIDSKYPYAEDLTQTRTGLADGVLTTIHNGGTAIFLPVFQVNRLNGVTGGSPVTDFQITNADTGQQIIYSSSLPGAGPIPGGHYGEVDTFEETIFEDGNGADLDAGIDELNTSSPYLYLQPGDNDITVDGADADILWQNAWA